jgi:signal transduction histidine kinase
MKRRLKEFLFWRKEKQSLLEKEQEEHRKLEEKEQEVKKLSEDVVWFKRLMAHNLRMPLAIITGYGELLANESFSSREEELDCIRKICNNIDYLDTLSKVLLDDNQGELLSQKEYFDMLACVRRVSEYVRTITQKAGIKIVVNSSRDEVLFFGNRISLMRAFFNLIENSVRYMNRQGNIFITVEETEKEVLIVYRDDGEGMRPEEAAHITELDYQGSNKRREGHGIGMYLIKETVESQGGSLEIKTGEGAGMGIYMSFPKNLQKNL